MKNKSQTVSDNNLPISQTSSANACLLNLLSDCPFDARIYAGFNGTPQNSEYQKPMTTGLELEEECANIGDDAILKAEGELYEKNKDRYLQEFEGEYIALLYGEVIAHSPNFSELATKAYEKAGYRAIFMTRVEKKEKIYKMATPKLV